jgi:competence protein ComEC
MQYKVNLFDNIFEDQKGRFLLWLPLIIAIGSSLYFTINFEPVLAFSLLITCCIFIAIHILRQRNLNDVIFHIVSLVALCLLWCGIGFSIAQIRTYWVAAPVLNKEVRMATIEGTVHSIEKMEDGQRILLKDLEGLKLQPDKVPHYVRIKLRDDTPLSNGMRISLRASLQPPSMPALPGSFDFQRHSFFKRIGGYGYSNGNIEILEQGNENYFSLDNVREKIVKHVLSHVNEREAGIAIALMIGERGVVYDEDWRAMQISGLAHMLSISGMHVGIVAAISFFFARMILVFSPIVSISSRSKKIAAFIALLFTAAYTILAVPTVPSYRSLLMSAFILVAIMLERSPFSLRTIALAAVIILLIVPESILSVSFQLSFAATAALIFVYQETTELRKNLKRKFGALEVLPLYFGGVIITTLVASTATAPIAIYHFQEYSTYGVLGNLLGVPVLSFIIMPIIMVLFIAMPLGLDVYLYPILAWGISLLNEISHFVSQLPHSQIVIASWPFMSIILFVLACYIFMVWQGALRKYIFLLLMVPAILFIIFNNQPDILVSDDSKLVALRSDNGKVYLSDKKEKFVAGIWMKYWGRTLDQAHYFKDKNYHDDFIKCDDYACRALMRDKKVSVIKTPLAHKDECHWADVLITNAPMKQKPCGNALVIDRYDTWKEGGYAVWLPGLKNISVLDARGLRPWSSSFAPSPRK